MERSLENSIPKILVESNEEEAGKSIIQAKLKNSQFLLERTRESTSQEVMSGDQKQFLEMGYGVHVLRYTHSGEIRSENRVNAQNHSSSYTQI